MRKVKSGTDYMCGGGGMWRRWWGPNGPKGPAITGGGIPSGEVMESELKFIRRLAGTPRFSQLIHDSRAVKSVVEQNKMQKIVNYTAVS